MTPDQITALQRENEELKAILETDRAISQAVNTQNEELKAVLALHAEVNRLRHRLIHGSFPDAEHRTLDQQRDKLQAEVELLRGKLSELEQHRASIKGKHK